MKFINLSKDYSHSSWNTIEKFGCGPNFVLNRQDQFESMIRDQGFVFWFRFWLTFCFDPGCKELKEKQNEWSEAKDAVNIFIHQQFLQGSAEDAISYCLHKVIKRLKICKNTSFGKWRTLHQMYSELLKECTEIAFATALCDVFHKWLTTNAMEENQTYWEIPYTFLDHKFEPGVLESYLINYWEDNLVSLLGVHTRQVPWILKQLYAPEPMKHFQKPFTDLFPMSEKVVPFLKSFRNLKKADIESVDELPKFDEHTTANNTANDLNSKLLTNDTIKNSVFDIMYMNHRQCSHCLSLECIATKFQICKRCKEECIDCPRYYCCDVCQMEDWFQLHCIEHDKKKG